MRIRSIAVIGLCIMALLATIAQPTHAADQVVTDCVNFTGPNSLTEAVADAIATGGGTVTFACPAGTTIVTNSELFISINTVTINGGNNITLDANSMSRIAYINPGATLHMQNIILRNGASGFGGSFYNDGTLSLTNVDVIDSVATAQGGGIWNATGRPVTLTNTEFINNVSGGGAGSGGAIYSQGTVTASGSGFYNNTCVGTITDNGGNIRDTTSTGCPGSVNLLVIRNCVGNDLRVNIVDGDGNFNISSSTLGDLGDYASGVHPFTGPNNWGTLTITELSGDLQTLNLPNVICPVPVALNANAVCLGNDMEVTISAGDGNFNISSSTLGDLSDYAIGTHPFTGPNNWGTVTVTELSGNGESASFPGLNCFIGDTLIATAVCNGANLEITISNGNAPFSISVTDSTGTNNTGSLPFGTYTYMGPDTFTDIGIAEDGGDLETLDLLDVTCVAPPVPPAPPAPVVLSPDLTALGCVVTVDVDIFNAPDNTYCRLLMRDGAVVGYSGAIPAELIDLGVKVAVDVYRMDGGRSITTFPNYVQICLAGVGRLFYMDARNAPRGIVELDAESVDGVTCGWIPAVGTLILTN